MKIGTIIKNNWAGDKNPSKYFIYTGIEGKYATGLSLVGGKLKKVKYYKRDFDGKEAFETVGYSKGFDMLKESLEVLI